MVFKNYYYRIVKNDISDKNGLFEIEYIQDCKVFDGHFPGNPICPGVLNMEVVRECTGKMLGCDMPRITEIRQCRFMELLTPEKTPKVSLYIEVEKDKTEYNVTATIKDGTSNCMVFKGKMSV